MRRKITYKLKRLPDVNGEMNWKLSRITKIDAKPDVYKVTEKIIK